MMNVILLLASEIIYLYVRKLIARGERPVYEFIIKV